MTGAGAVVDWRTAGTVAPGQILATVALPPVTATQLAFYCAAAGVTDPIHYDRDYAKSFGFLDLVVNGSLRVAWLTQAVIGLVAPPDRLLSIACSHRGLMLIGEAPVIAVCARSVAPADDGARLLTCEVTAHIGERLADTATAILRLQAPQ